MQSASTKHRRKTHLLPPGHTAGQDLLLHKVEGGTLNGALVAQTMPLSLGYLLSLSKASSPPRKAITSGQWQDDGKG